MNTVPVKPITGPVALGKMMVALELSEPLGAAGVSLSLSRPFQDHSRNDEPVVW